MEHNREGEITVTWQECLRAFENNVKMVAEDYPYVDMIHWKREMRKWCKQARKILAAEKEVK